MATTTSLSPAMGVPESPKISTGNAGPASFTRIPMIVHQGANFPGVHAAEERIPHAQCSLLNQHGGHRPAARVQFRFDHHPLGRPVGIGFQFQQFRFDQNHFQQFIDVGF
jgi:hypothetical protein